MNHSEYFAIREYLPETVSAAALSNQAPRTLVLGYDVQRNTFHVYLNERGLLQRVLYDHDGFLIDAYESDTFEAADCVPDKRIYPAKSDFEFCKLLSRTLHRDLPFTTFMDVVEPKQFYGKLQEELIEADFRDFEVFVKVDDELAEKVISCVAPAAYQAPLRFAPQANIRGRIEGVLESALERLMRNEKLGAGNPELLARIKPNVEWAFGMFLRDQGFADSAASPTVVSLTDDVELLLREVAETALAAHREKLKVAV